MSIRSKLIQAYFRLNFKRDGLSQEALIKKSRASMNNAPMVSLLPKGVRITEIDSPLFSGEKVYSGQDDITVLYFHGGAYVAGVTRTYHNFAARLSKKLNGEVYLARYPFAPEHPFPAAINCCLDAYQYLLDQGKDPKKIVLAGDSAGGGLALGTLLHIRDNELPLPRCTVTLSPATTCLPDQSMLTRLDASDAMLSADMVNTFTEIYVPHEADRTHPYASPALGDYSGLPPVQVLVCPEEVLYENALQLRKALEKAGTSLNWYERSGVFHVWPIMVPFLPEANTDLQRITDFILTPS